MNDQNHIPRNIWLVMFAELIAGLACYGAVVCVASLEKLDDF